MTQLIVENVSKGFPNGEQSLTVLQEASLQLAAGDSLAIVGPSGSGKTTLLQIIGALDRPDSGTVQLDGEDPFSLSENDLAAWRNQRIGFVFQDHHLLPQLTVMENVLVPTLAGHSSGDESQARATELLNAVGLDQRCDHLPGQLSGGERERVAIARALLMKPKLILADEPTGNLDRRTATAFTEVLQQLQREQQAILICVTHSDSLADAMDQKLELLDGKLHAAT